MENGKINNINLILDKGWSRPLFLKRGKCDLGPWAVETTCGMVHPIGKTT